MQFLLDHIAAVVITGFIIFIIAAVSLRGQDTSIDSTQYYAQKRMLLDLVQFVERDFTNIGAGVNPVADIIQPGAFDTSGATKFFQFRGRADSTDLFASIIRYEWDQVGTLELSSGTTPALRIRRLVTPLTPPGPQVVAGMSSGYITSFDIDFFAQGGTSVAPTVDSMRVVRVDITAVSPLGRGNNIEQSWWTKVFRPVNLTRTD